MVLDGWQLTVPGESRSRLVELVRNIYDLSTTFGVATEHSVGDLNMFTSYPCMMNI